MNKLRSISIALIFILCIPIIAVPAQADAASSVSAFARLAGTSGPVLTAISNCVIGELTGKAESMATAAVAKAESTVQAQVDAGLTSQAAYDDFMNNAKNDAHKQICLVPMERAAAQVILNTLTTETVNWINGGMNGAPMYISDPAKSFQDLQKKAIGSFADTISSGFKGCDKLSTSSTGQQAADDCIYPFGKMLLQDTMKQLNSSFQNDLKSNLKNALPDGITPINFSKNFNNGGWSAFSMALMPNNNPIGSSQMMDNQLSKLLKNTNWSPADELKTQLQKNGFLDQKECVSPSGADPTHTVATSSTDTSPICLKTKIVTPGSVILDKLNTSLHATQDSLITGQQLDASITAVFDALMNNLLQQGLSSLSSDSGGSSSSPQDGATPGDTQTTNTVEGNATGGSLCGVASSADWYAQYPNFSILTGLNDGRDFNGKVYMTSDVPPKPAYPGLITREKQLRAILVDQDITISWIINSIYTLDMCVPGPNTINTPGIKDKIFGEIMTDYNYPGSSVDQINEIYNAQFLNDHLGVKFYPTSALKSPAAVQKIIKTIISRYYDALSNQYGNLGRIEAYPKIEEYWGKLGYYQQQLADNKAKIGIIDGNVAQLNSIRVRVDAWKTITNLPDEKKQELFQKIVDQFNVLIPDLDVSPYAKTPPSLNQQQVQQGSPSAHP